jgi:hypothetical protein
VRRRDQQLYIDLVLKAPPRRTKSFTTGFALTGLEGSKVGQVFISATLRLQA